MIDLAHAAARRQAQALGDDFVIAYHYRLAANAIWRSLAGRPPTATTAQLAQVAQACEREASRRTQAADGYGTAG